MVNIVVSVPAELASQLEFLARSQRVSRSSLIRDTLSLALCGKPVKPVVCGFQANRDGMDDAAQSFIEAHPEMSVRRLVRELDALGIKRGKTWVSETKSDLSRCGARIT
jgi:hypothetical protein